MLPRICVVVPTYWGRPGGERRSGDAVYDHPTPVDGESTLPALLDSLAKLDTSRYYLLILVAVTTPEVAEAAEKRAGDIVAGFPAVRSLVFGPSSLRWLHSWLERRAMSDATAFLRLEGYANVRNLQLALPLALQSKAIVALDDDEIVTDPAFLEKATRPLGTELDGRRVAGLSGFYVQADGGILLQVDARQASSSNIFKRKAAIMNAAARKLEDEPGDLVFTPFCFGGNMEFTPELAAAVGFDPGITRGEDIDYLINARLEGFDMFLCKDLRILHCPPSGGSYKDASLTKLEQDVVRFLYEREKLRASQAMDALLPVSAEELMPYPGEFLVGDLDGNAAEALSAAGFEGDAAEFVRAAAQSARRRLVEYLDFRERWPAVIEIVRHDSYVQERLLAPAASP